MKKISLNNILMILRVSIIVFAISIISLFLFSFSVNKMNDEFLKELGISKSDADTKITKSILGGYLDVSGAKNAKNILLGNRTAVTNDLLNYVKQHVNTTAFKTEYNSLKESNKPNEVKVKTPEEVRQETIDAYKKSVADMEATIKKADAGVKPIFEKVLAESKKMLKDAEDPNNKNFAGYAKAYPDMVKGNRQAYEGQMKGWEEQYPANHLLFVKQRLQQFMEETKDIDYAAELTIINGKKIFVNKAYESKSNRWKMAFRAGKEVVEPARTFVKQWISEIN